MAAACTSRHAVALALFATLGASPAFGEPITVAAHAVILDPGDPAHTRVGALEFVGGLRLTSPDTRFGGLSDLSVSADGTRLLAVSDRGLWFSAQIGWDAGALATLTAADLTPMLDMKGKPLVPPLSDAEALVTTAAGRIVAFEREHRLWLYPGDWPFTTPPQAVAAPADLRRAPSNGGAEAVVALADGRLVVFAEELKVPGGRAAWVQDSAGAFAAFTLETAPGFAPSSAARLPNGDVLLLERQFTVFARATRIVRIRAADLLPGARVAGEEVALIASPLTLDNMEGIAAIRAADGSTLLFLVSDDNFSVLERTLLLVFRLAA